MKGRFSFDQQVWSEIPLRFTFEATFDEWAAIVKDLESIEATYAISDRTRGFLRCSRNLVTCVREATGCMYSTHHSEFHCTPEKLTDRAASPDAKPGGSESSTERQYRRD